MKLGSYQSGKLITSIRHVQFSHKDNRYGRLTGTFVNTKCSEAELGVRVGNVLELCVAVRELRRTESDTTSFVLERLARLHHKQPHSSSAY